MEPGQAADAQRRRGRTAERRHTVPAQPGALLGRAAEVAVLRRLLLDDGVRLLTLTGPAGVGKTRLALAVAETLYKAFPDGVHVVSLAPIADPGLVPATVAQALDVREVGSRTTLESLVAHLCERRALLVLDNFEQVLGAAPRLADLIAACPRLTLLVTSRAALRLRWEHQSPVLPLALPDRQRTADFAAVAGAPAVALFVERALAVRPEFALTPANAPVVAEICFRLDGLPLALELAAARLRLLTPQTLLERLEHRLQLLTGGALDLPERQRTLRQAIAWSYALLGEREQTLFRRLGVFVGSCTLEAAEAVCGGTDGDVLTEIASLVDASLLQREELPQGEIRVSMLETIREFAVEQLEAAGEAQAARRRHAECYLRFAELAGTELDGPQQVTWLERVGREYDNLRGALIHATSAGDDAGLALRLATALFNFWEVRGYYREGREWLATALARSEGEDATARARALRQLGGLALRQGDKVAARAHLEQSLALLRAVGDKPGTARLLNNLALLAWNEGDLTAARSLLDECTALVRELGDGPGVAMALNNRGLLETVVGNHEVATDFLEECIALCRASGYTRWLALSLLNLGWCAVAQGHCDEATGYAAESLRLCQVLGFRIVRAHSVAVLGMVALRREQSERAVRLFAASGALLDAAGLARDEPIPAEVDRLAAALRTRLGEQAFARAWAEGSAMSTDEAVDYALAEPAHAQSAPRGGRELEVPGPEAARESDVGRAAAQLSGREREVLGLVAAGHTTKEIADELVLSVATVNRHLANIYTKIGTRNRAEATAFALGRGLAATRTP